MSEASNVILLVEDNRQDAELLLDALRELGFEYEVALARDGIEAIAFARCSPPPRLVLLDLKMPKVDGIEVIRKLKSDEMTSCIPIVVFTSSSQERDVRDAYRSGANGYVVKPVDIDAFSSVVATLGRYWLAANRVPRP
jgi:two-component system response regulator